MKHIIIILTIIILASCQKDTPTDPTNEYNYESEYETPQKEIKQYTLNFRASHWVDQINQYTDPFAYFSWKIEDESNIKTFDQSGIINMQVTNATATAKTGDWIFIYISVNDVYCNGMVSCKSIDGSINLYKSTDNLYIDEGTGITAKSKSLFSRKVIEYRTQLK